MNPGEEIDNQLDALETKIELLMTHLGLEFEFDNAWSDEPTGIREVKKGGRMTDNTRLDVIIQQLKRIANSLEKLTEEKK